MKNNGGSVGFVIFIRFGSVDDEEDVNRGGEIGGVARGLSADVAGGVCFGGEVDSYEEEEEEEGESGGSSRDDTCWGQHGGD